MKEVKIEGILYRNKSDVRKIIAWAKKEIKEYEKFIKLCESKIKEL